MYTMRLPPRDCQREALAKMNGHQAFALHMAMRTGKTKVIIDDFGQLEDDGKVEDLLVIAPGGCYQTWRTAWQDHAAASLASRTIIYVWKSRKRSERAKQIMKSFLIPGNYPRLFLMNVEALSSVKEARNAVEKFVQQRRCMVVIDESTCIKKITTKRSRFIINKLKPHATFRRTLSGLPNPRSPLDLFGQFEFLDNSILGFNNFAAFKERYAEEERKCFVPKVILKEKLRKLVGSDSMLIEGFGLFLLNDMTQTQLFNELKKRGVYVPSVPQLNGYKNLQELQQKIAPYCYRKTLEECYDMPPKQYVRREIELTDEQQKAYDELRDFFTTQLTNEEHVTAVNVVGCMTKLHQILCGHVKDEQGAEHHIHTNRISSLLSLLEEFDGKAIIWCSYDWDVAEISRHLSNEYGEGSYARFWGGNRATRETEEQLFKSDPDCRFMIATPAAGGKGRTWDNASMCVYYSNTYDLEARMQSEERPQAVGKMNSILYVDLVAPDTVDEKFLYVLRNKLDLATLVNGDNYKEWLI